jgi:hypothetical protein
MDANVEASPEVLFRPVKRRKFQRRRPEDTDFQKETQPSPEHISASQSPRNDSETEQATDYLRLRRLHRSRKCGIEFSTASRPTADQPNQTSISASTAEDMESERLRAMCDRFTAHTGQTVDVDKHMYGAPNIMNVDSKYCLQWRLTR